MLESRCVLIRSVFQIHSSIIIIITDVVITMSIDLAWCYHVYSAYPSISPCYMQERSDTERVYRRENLQEYTERGIRISQCYTGEILYFYPDIHVQLPIPEGAKRATSVSVQPLRLRKDLRTGSISRDVTIIIIMMIIIIISSSSSSSFPSGALQAQRWHSCPDQSGYGLSFFWGGFKSLEGHM